MAPDGAVRAIVGGRDYEVSQFNRATDALRQPGSSFKPFVYLAALLNGFTPETIVVDGPVSVGNWSPRNYTGKYAGRTTLTTALAHSYNSVPVQAHARHRPQGDHRNRAPRRHPGRARNLAADGARHQRADAARSHHRLCHLRRRRNSWPSPIRFSKSAAPMAISSTAAAERSAAAARRCVPEEKIAELNSMLNAVVKNGTGRRAFLGFTPQGGKTGTNQSYRDAWFIGFTAHNVTGVWFGNDDFTEMNKVTGGLLPAPTWKKIMLVAEQSADAARAWPASPMTRAMPNMPRPMPTNSILPPTKSTAASRNDASRRRSGWRHPGPQRYVQPVQGGRTRAARREKAAAPSQQEAFVLPRDNMLVLPRANTDRKKKKSFLIRSLARWMKRRRRKSGSANRCSVSDHVLRKLPGFPRLSRHRRLCRADQCRCCRRVRRFRAGGAGKHLAQPRYRIADFRQPLWRGLLSSSGTATGLDQSNP